MLLLVLKAHADHTMVILSDPHVMASSLLKSPGSAWDAHLSESRKLVDYSQPLFDEMIDRIKNDIKPQLVLITGDLTKDAEVDSHHAVLSKLNELRAAGIKNIFAWSYRGTETLSWLKSDNPDEVARVFRKAVL